MTHCPDQARIDLEMSRRRAGEMALAVGHLPYDEHNQPYAVDTSPQRVVLPDPAALVTVHGEHPDVYRYEAGHMLRRLRRWDGQQYVAADPDDVQYVGPVTER